MAALLQGGSFNGLSWGPGTKFHVNAVSGFDDLPPMRTFDAARPGDHGQFRGIDLLGPRTVMLDILIQGDTNPDYYAQVQMLQNAFLLNSVELPFLFFNSSKLINARCRRRAVPYMADGIYRTGTASVQIDATDPRVYNASQSSASVGLGTAGTGFVFPFTFPFSFGAGATGNTFGALNNGNFPTPMVATIQGPVTNPGIQNVTSGLSVIVDLVLGVTDILVVDFNARTVVLNGTASRRNALDGVSRWWQLAPGNSTIKFLGSGGGGGTLLTATWRDAWI